MYSIHIDKENIKLETRNVAALPWCWDCKRWAGRREGNFLGYGGEMGETGAYIDASCMHMQCVMSFF